MRMHFVNSKVFFQMVAVILRYFIAGASYSYCIISDSRNLVSLNKNAIHFAHEPAVGQDMEGVLHLCSTQCPLGQLQRSCLAADEGSLTPSPAS